MTAVPIRTPDPDETPLSKAEQCVAIRLGIKPKRVFMPRFWWRAVDAERTARAPAFSGGER